MEWSLVSPGCEVCHVGTFAAVMVHVGETCMFLLILFAYIKGAYLTTNLILVAPIT